MNFSYWEQETWLKHIDFTIVGSGIVGLSTAIHLKRRYPKAKILILERGVLPHGASTKNAGFACFGSLSEMIMDIDAADESALVDLVDRRRTGLALLRETSGDEAIDYKQYGGYELFLRHDEALYESCKSRINEVNKLLKPLIKDDVFTFRPDPFHFDGVYPELVYNPYEGQINTGAMMHALLKKATSLDIRILTQCKVTSYTASVDKVHIVTPYTEITSRQLFICTNGFAPQLLPDVEVVPARAQVLITKPIPNLEIKGTFHFDEGYYYFRNIDDRILLGGARNIDIEGETTSSIEVAEHIQTQLDKMLREVILPRYDTLEIDHRWAGIMGMGKQKTPIIHSLNHNVHYGVRLSGMGIAIGSQLGKELSERV